MTIKPHALSPAALVSACIPGLACAADVPIAVAANFAAPMKRLAADFMVDTGYKMNVSHGSTGKLYAQIKNGAPFEVFLAADATTPARLVAERDAIGGSQFTYAFGKLVLWSVKPGLVDDKGDVLRRGNFDRLAIANPKLAPYGVAAVETMRSLGVLHALQPKFATGESTAQTYQFIATGNAQLGFVALSQVMKDGKITTGSAWIVDPARYPPIRQDAVLLGRGADKPAAQALLNYLRSAKAQAVIRSYGYDTHAVPR